MERNTITGLDVAFNVLAHVHHVTGQSMEILRSSFVDWIILLAPDICGKPYAELNDKEFMKLSVEIIRDIIAELNEKLGTEYSIMNYSKRKFDANSVL